MSHQEKVEKKSLERNLLAEKDLKACTDTMILIHDSSFISMKEKLSNKKFNLFYLNLFHKNLSPFKKANNCSSEEKNKLKKIINLREGDKPEKINYSSSINLRELFEETKIEEIMKQINKN